MNTKISLIIAFILVSFSPLIRAQVPKYVFSLRTEVRQGAALAQLKNPFVGGFLLPQFCAIDINMDLTDDLLIFDRGTKKFYTFLNDRIPNTVSYTYAPQYESKFPECQNFCLSYDYNNDGKMDLYVEANGFVEQYRNTSNTSLSFATPDTLLDYTGINIYCPSTNIPSFNDIDNDGDMDILSWDPTGFTINLYKNWRVEQGLTKNEWKYKLADECWGKFFLSFSLNLGYHCKGLAYYPNGDDYSPPPAPNGGGAHQGSTLLTLDIDDDGDYEALLGDIFYDYLYFLKNGKKDFNYPKDTMIDKDSLYPSLAHRMAINNFPAAFFLDVDNDGKRDIILAPNDQSGSSKSVDQIFFYKNIGTDKKPIFSLIQKNFLQETTIDFGGVTAPTFTDIDGDGDNDLFISSQGDFTKTLNTKDFIVYYKNTGTAVNPIFLLQDTNFLNLSSKGYSGLKPCFGDLNGDGKKDLLIGESNGGLIYFENTSSGGNISFSQNTTKFSTFQSSNYSAPFLVDYDRDGKLDLFLGNYDGIIGYYRNTGTATNPIFTKMVDSVGKVCLRLVDDLRNFYGDGASVPIVADLDNDGKFDLLVGGKYGLYSYKNMEGKMSDSLTLVDTTVRNSYSQLLASKVRGLYFSPAVSQLDSDNVYPDLMLGNKGGGLNYFATYDYKAKVGIKNYTSIVNKLSIIPNPATGIIQLEGLEDETFSIQIVDATGKQILAWQERTGKRQSIDISGFEKGVYFLTLTSNEGEVYIGKFIKM